ncbi:MAG: hypothetical protein ABEJ04_02175 [Halobacteriaceae archaeon]
MERDAIAAWVGVGACLAVLVLVAAPYALVSAATVAVYYGVGPVGPPFLAVFAAVALVALGGALGGRSDPGTVSGVALVFGLVVAGFSVWWAARAGGVAASIETTTLFAYHRYALAVAALAVPAAVAGYARAVL